MDIRNALNGHLITLGIALVTVGGTVAGVYSALHGDIVENHATLLGEIKQFQDVTAAQREWNRDERSYDAETRTRLTQMEKESRESFQRFNDRIDLLLRALATSAAPK